jgi:predicted RND superfamily exporter protein
LFARAYIDFVLRHRVAILALCTAASVLAGWRISDGVLASSMRKLFFGANPKYDSYLELASQFGESNLVVVAFDFPKATTPEGMATLDRITSAIQRVEGVGQVDSVASATRIRSVDDILEVRSWADAFVHGGDPESLRRELGDDELVTGLFLSLDQRTVVVLVEYASEGDEERPAEELSVFLDEIVAPIVAEGVPRAGIHLAGLMPETVAVIGQTHFNLERLFPFSALALMVVVFVLFLRLWPVVITLGTAGMAILWVFAAAVTIDREINVMMATVPAVIMIISFSDVIHLCTAYVLELQGGHDKRAAILKSGGEVGTACFYTSLTTLVGFASLAFVPTPLFRQLGLVLGLGVAVALMLAVTLTPILFWYLPMPRPRDTLADRIIDRLNGHALRMAVGRAPWVLAATAVVVTVALVGTLRLRAETDLPARLAPDNPLRVAQRFVQERFAGTNFVDLYLFSDNPHDFLDADRFAAVAALQQQVEAYPEVDRVLSLIDLVEILHRELAQPAEGETLPDSRALLAQYLILFEAAGGEGIEQLIGDERRVLRMTLRLPGSGLVETAAVGERAATLAGSIDGVSARATGLTYLFGDWIEFVIAGQKRGLFFALTTIALMMIVTLRRIGAGLVSMLPNVLPLLCLGGYLGLAWTAVDSDTLIVAMIAIGIAVDDTIHFLTRLRIETERDAEINGALRRTFAFTGRAMVQTTVVLAAGFLPFALSDYFTTRILGTLLPATLVVALVADLWLATALVKLRLLRVGR